MSDTMKIPTRNEAAQEDTWAIQDLFATDSLWWEEFNRSKGYVEKISAYRGRLSESGGTLLAYLLLYD